MDKFVLTIDSKDIVADTGETILEAALQNDIYIPHPSSQSVSPSPFEGEEKRSVIQHW